MSDPREPLDPSGEVELDPGVDPEIEPGGEGDDPLDPELDPEIDPDPEVDPEPQETQPRRRGRAAETITNLRTRAQTAETEIAALQRELEGLNNRPQPVDPYAAQRELEAENQRLEMMSPVEQARYIAAQSERRIEQRLAQQQFLAADTQDRRDYASLKREIPAATRLESQVEATLQTLRNQGIYAITREAILYNLVGAETVNRTRQSVGRQRQQGQRRIQQQTTRPANGRGDVARGTPSRDQRQADIDLLRGVTADAIMR